MMKSEFKRYLATATDAVLVDEVPGEDRTLVLGIARPPNTECDRGAWVLHVYKRNDELHTLLYQTLHRDPRHYRLSSTSGVSVPIEECIPREHAFPECCDLGFAELLRARGHALTFRPFGDTGLPGCPYQGCLIEETALYEG